MKDIKIVDYGAGNLRSVLNSLRAVATANETITLCNTPDDLLKADRVVLPGVGAYQACRDGIEEIDGMMDAIEAFAIEKARPFLGICVGMQLLVQSGEEHGNHTKGFGWLSGDVRLITPQNAQAKIPHMGWNNLQILTPHPVLEGLKTGDDVYFVHSYAVQGGAQSETIATTDYYGNITSIIAKDNIFGTQFHPEKSQKNGLRILRNFLDWRTT